MRVKSVPDLQSETRRISGMTEKISITGKQASAIIFDYAGKNIGTCSHPFCRYSTTQHAAEKDRPARGDAGKYGCFA